MPNKVGLRLHFDPKGYVQFSENLRKNYKEKKQRQKIKRNKSKEK